MEGHCMSNTINAHESTTADAPIVKAISLREYGERTAPIIADAQHAHRRLADSSQRFSGSTQALSGLLAGFRLPEPARA